MPTINVVGFMKRNYTFGSSNVMEILKENLLSSSNLL
jgi:hypothetical protein